MSAFSRTMRVLTTAFAKLQPLLPGRSIHNLDTFVGTLEQSNISKILFLRHGKTGPSPTGKDFDRLLTAEGRDQARDAGHVFGKKMQLLFSSLLVSSAPRTVETAKLFLDAYSGDQLRPELQIIPELYNGTMQPKGSALFKKIGYAPLRDYLENNNQEYRNDAQSVLGPYAYTVIDAIMDTAVKSQPSTSPSTLVVVSHAIYLPAAALGVASLVGCKDVKMTLDVETKEAEGFLIDISCAKIDYLSRGV